MSKFMRDAVIGLFTAFVLWANGAQAETLFGVVVGVTDGDTIPVLDEHKQQHTIRLFAIDAPETTCHALRPSVADADCVEHAQPFGRAAKKALASIVYGKNVNVELVPGNSYGREIGTVWTGNINANLEMVRVGLAWAYHQYARHMPADEYRQFQAAEQEAREHARGLWADPSPVPPWDFRHSAAPRQLLLGGGNV